MTRLRLPATLFFRSLMRAIGEQCPDKTIDEIDFADVKWVQPSGLAGLASLIRSMQDQTTVQAVNARQSHAFRYFQDMNFFQTFGIFQEEDFDRRPENPAFARLAEIIWNSNSSAIAKNLAKLISDHARPIHADIFTCFEESVRNVIDHARKPGFATAQSHPAAGGDRTYNIAICDYGRGIRASLSDNPQFQGIDSRQALELCVQKGVSSVGKGKPVSPDRENFGIGLYTIDRIAQTTKGRFVLASGDMIRIRDARGVRYESICGWNGTSVELTLYLSGFRALHVAPPSKGRLRFG